MTHKRSVRTSQ